MQPNLVFLDVMMPKLSGFDVCQRAKQDLGLTDVYIVLLTAKGQEFDRQKGQEVGADLYMTKPFDPDALLAEGPRRARHCERRWRRIAPEADHRAAAGGARAGRRRSSAALGAPRGRSRTRDGTAAARRAERAVDASASRCRTAMQRSAGSSGPNGAGAVAALLDHLVAREVERKALGAEVLHLYREINLIYSFSEKLAALLDVERVAQLTLQEARHLIVATDGVILLLDEATGALTSVAGFGDEMPALAGLPRAATASSATVAADRRRRDRQRRRARSAARRRATPRSRR